ncbi:hypothetical protein COK00_12060 [Bacillus cereus]|uniref:hypothetical protein n=1 Tax=Bacillus cereus group TaxID=86661 RepID=UPI000BFA86AF|nr:MULTISPECIES: hypothetical protein [Bacillus cereus group]MBJ8109130.1 hypothetical protein [Bacillus cereus group sp. N6]MCU5076816.1 hypothetical protein [Bacillus cereus]MDA1616363.1 hypothetical protein [Bacillus cereus group sp. TH204-1LC]MDA1918339.1 hypothetical protein [Bacillus cereus group sp. BcHK140]MDA1977031.1 hypothetical protein [Bacillus cereus]
MLEIQSSVWYRTVNVPVRTHNKEYGLKDIKVYPANALQKSYGMVCNCILYLVCGTIRVTIAESKNNPGTIYLITPGQTQVEVQGNPQYYENVQLSYELKAQVLKYVESLTKQV